MEDKTKIGQLLIEKGVTVPLTLDEALQEQTRRGDGTLLGQILVEMESCCTQDDVFFALEQQKKLRVSPPHRFLRLP